MREGHPSCLQARRLGHHPPTGWRRSVEKAVGKNAEEGAPVGQPAIGSHSLIN